jgi:site-specific recombinase XerD
MTRTIAYFQQPPAAPSPDAPLARPLRRRSFQNEVLVGKFDRYLLALNYSPRTRQRYGTCVKQLSAFLGDRNLVTATSNDVREFLASLYERNLSTSTRANVLYALRTFYHFLELGGQVRTSAPQTVHAPKLPTRLPHAKSEEEIEQLLNAAQTPRDRALLELAYASGLRVSELAHLQCEDVDLRAGSLVVRHGKGDKDRVGLFGNKAAAALRIYLGDRRSGSLFGITSRSIGRIVAKIAKRANVAGVHPHVFRSSMATHLLNRGSDIRFVQELLGHTSLVATQKYLAVATSRLSEVHGQFHPRG